MTTFQPREATVTIYQGDYLDRLRHLEQRHKAALEAEANTTRLSSDIPESVEIRAEYDALKAEADETALDLSLFALGRKVWRALVAEHPPRKDNDSDEAMGVNEEAFKDALVPLALQYPDEHEKFGQEQISEAQLDRLSDIDFDRLYYSAFALNRAPASTPKALALPPSPKKDVTSN